MAREIRLASRTPAHAEALAAAAPVTTTVVGSFEEALRRARTKSVDRRLAIAGAAA